MVSELERLLSNAYAPFDNIAYSAIVLMKDQNTFGGVCIKNQIYRNVINAEEVAISRCLSSGYKYGDIEALYIMVSTNNINDLKYINKDYITEFMEPDKCVYLYDLNRNERIIKVGNLFDNIY